MAKLLLNAVSVSSTPGAKVRVGQQPYDRDTLTSLRRAHRGEYLFKRGGEDGSLILSVAMKTGLAPIGTEIDEVSLSEAPWLLAPLALEALLGVFVDLQRPVLKWRPLRVLSQQPLNLYPSNCRLPDWLQRRIVLDFETRSIKRREQAAVVELACGVRTSNVIDANCAMLLAAGIELRGRYVATRRTVDDPRVKGTLSLAGRVTGYRGNSLTLDDHGEGSPTIDSSLAFLEPRKENMVWCTRHFLGAESDRVLEAVDNAATTHLSGPERLALIRRTFDYLRKRPIDLAPGASLALGPLAGSASGSWPFRSERIQKPTLVFDPSGTRTDTWNQQGLDKNGPYDQRTFAPKRLRIAVVCQASYEGQVEAFLAKFLDGLPNVRVGSGDWVRVPYEKGFIRRYALEAPNVQTFTARGSSVADYTDACRNAIEAATDGGFEWTLAVVQIDQDFKELGDRENPYFAVKAAFLKHRVAIQEITLETMRFPDEQLVFALNNMSVAAYAKIGGVPWLLKSQPTVAHELVVGIGSHTLSTSRLGAQERVVGITTVFSSDGKYLLDDRTAAVPYGQYKDALYKSLSRSIENVRQVDNWRSTDAVRLIFHVFKEVADHEAEAVRELVETLGLTQVRYAFLHLVDNHPFTLFDEGNKGVRQRGGMKGVYVPERGLTVGLGDSESLLCFTGSRDVKHARHGMPQPTLLRLHRRSTFRDMTYLTRQAFDFSCHSWRMFTPAPQPITIHYSELIARLLSGLRQVPGWDPDTMLGPISRTRWFL